MTIYQIPPNKPRNPISGLLDKVKSYLDPANVLPKINNTSSLPPVPQVYQIRDDDRDMKSIASRYNLPLDSVIAANGGVDTIPDRGSYINLQQPPDINAGRANRPSLPGQLGAQAGTTALSIAQRPPVGYGPVSAAAQATTSRADSGPTQGRGGLQYTNAGPIAQSSNTIKAFDTMNENFRLTGKLDPSVLPQNISLATVKQMDQAGAFTNAVDANGNPMTPAQALGAYGFVFKNGQYTQTGGSGGSSGASGPVSAATQRANEINANQKNAGGWHLVRNAKGKLVWQLARKGPDIVNAPPPLPEAMNVGSTPENVLASNLASG